jgi:hypothetical protein
MAEMAELSGEDEERAYCCCCCHDRVLYLGGDLTKAKFNDEAAAMAGHEEARYNLGNLEAESGNIE